MIENTIKKMIIIGAGGHGKVVADIAKKNQYEVIGFIDDNENKKKNGKYDVIGTIKDIDMYLNSDDDKYSNLYFFVAIGNNQMREEISKLLMKKGIIQPTLIHPSAVIDDSVSIGEGTVVMANVVINADTNVGSACIINTSSSVDHDCIIEDYVHISPGVHIAGTVKVGKRTWIGIGTSIINNISLNEYVIIGAGSSVIKDIDDKGIYFGIPAKKNYG
ncbi:acetyltransferase [Candidatus Stoquefichus massiliensis]|uniref:acetyltransferase n=1 Tax=Candidatus Stoquefichus massiliensis TaxID=1470350 RepID=UPI0004815299|nr:acetyltransferase [Candidatus Stoquefichus massiliensis]